MFFLMKELSGILRSRRHTRGSIDFDFPESKIILNAAKEELLMCNLMKPMWQPGSTEIFMLLANETVAQEYCGVSFITERMKIRIRKRLKVF